jgi:Mg2+ and Co2+ transporter CorA
LQGYADFPWSMRSPAQHTQHLSGPPRSSLFDDIVFFWENAAPNDIAAAISDPRISTTIVKRFLRSAWFVQLESISIMISKLEIKLWGFEEMEHQPSPDAIKREILELHDLLMSVNRWRRRIWWYMDHMRHNLEALREPSSNGNPTLKGGKYETQRASVGNGDHILEDFSSIHEGLRHCRDRTQSLMPVVMGAISLLQAQQIALETKYVASLTEQSTLESKQVTELTEQSALESKYMTRLTVLALVFAPLSFTTGLFSMSGSYLPGQSDFWIFWVAALPLVVLVFATVFSARYIESRWRRP